MEKNLKIEVVEALKLREFTPTEQKVFVKQIADIYGCRPLQADIESFYEFLTVVFNAGRIHGVRNERIKKIGVI